VHKNNILFFIPQYFLIKSFWSRIEGLFDETLIFQYFLPMTDIKEILRFDNETEARKLEQYLLQGDIPFTIRSFKDLAYDGIFQIHQGWGVLEAPPEYEQRILDIYHDLGGQKQSPPISQEKSSFNPWLVISAAALLLLAGAFLR